MIKTKFTTLIIALIVMFAAILYFDTNQNRFVHKTSNLYQYDTIGIKKKEFNSLIVNYFGIKHYPEYMVDSSAFDHYSVTIKNIGDPADFLNKNYKTLFSATRKQNGFEVKLEGNAPPYARLDLIMNADNEFVVVPAGVLAMLIN
jgi:hypothetical protein